MVWGDYDAEIMDTQAPQVSSSRIVPRVGAGVRPNPGMMAGFSRYARLPRKEKPWLVESLFPSQPLLWAFRALLPMPQQLASSKLKKDIIVILDVGHTDKDSGQISARGVKEYDFNMKLGQRVLEELFNTGLLSTQMIVMSGSNTHESRLQRSKRANDVDADLFISIHHDGVKNETLMPWQYNGKQHWFLDKFEGFSLWVSKKNNKYEESLSFATTLADRLMASGLNFTTHHDELTNTAKYGRIAPLVDRGRGIYDASDNIAVLYESRMPALLLEAGMIVNRAEEQVLSSPARRAAVAKAVAEAVERFCAVRAPQT